MIHHFIKSYIPILILMLLSPLASAATFTISTPTASGQFTLSWSDARSFAELYEVVNGSTSQIGGQYAKTHSITYTKPPGTYTYIVVDVLTYSCGTCPGGVAQNRVSIQRTVVVSQPVAPEMPANISVIPDNFTNSISVSWDQSTGASRYEVELNGSNVHSALGTNTTQANLQVNTNYTFRVRACNTYGCSSWNTANAVTLVETFSAPSTSTTGEYSITAVTPPGSTHTRIEERVGSGGNWAEIATLSAGNQSYSVTRINGTYYYRLSYCYFHAQSQTCTPRNGERSTVVSIPQPVVTANFTPGIINEGGSTELVWSSSNATTCSAAGITGVSAPNGRANYTASNVMSANIVVNITVTCTGGGGSGSTTAPLTVNWVNDAPIISSISSKSIAEDSNTGAIAFTVNDEETSAAALSVSAVSDNQSVIPNGNIQLTNNGVNRTISLTPTTNQHGVARITIKVTDANGLSVETSFDVVVNGVDDAPVISAINNVTINELGTATVNFTVTDIDSLVSGVTVNSDSNGIVTPVLSGSGNSYSVALTAGAITIDSSSSGATITVSVPFSPAPATRSFFATVNNVDPQLWITDTGTIGVYTLNWKFGTAATKIFQNGVDITTLIDPSGYAPVSGSKQITKTANGTFNYYISDCVRATQGSLSCRGAHSPVSKTVTFPTPTVTASFNKTSINEANAGATNTTADLTWSSTDADSCSASGITGVSATSGNKTYTAPANLVTNQLHKVIVTCTGKGGSAQDDAELTLAALNDSPVATITSTINAREDEVFYIPFTAADEETTLTASHLIITSSDSAKVPAANIQIELGANPRLVVTPVANASGTLTIKLKAKDPGNAESAEVTSNITIAAVDDAPVISAINNVTINELGTATVNFTVTDIDSSVSGVTVSSESNTIVTPVLSGSGNSYSIALTAGAITIDSSSSGATITVSVPFSPAPATRSFFATVNNVDPQLWITDSGTIGVYTLNWKFGTAATKIFQNGVDITTLIDPSGYAPVSGSKQITKTANGTFNYHISDCVRGTQGSFSCQGTYSPVSKTVTFPVPTVTASFNKTSVNEANAGATNTTADLTWSSTNADSCSASEITGVSATSGNKTYTAPANLITNQLHKVIVTCTGKGGSAQDDAELTLAALNDSPVATITSTINAREDEVFYIPFTAADEETTLTASHLIITSSDSAKVPAANIQIELGANPRLVVTPVANANGTLSIKLKAKDPGNAESAEVTSNITIAAVDDAPVISAINNVTMNELGTATVNFTVTDIDSSVSGVTVSSESNTIVTPVLSGSGNSYSIALTAGAITTDSSNLGAIITVSVPFSPAPVTRNFTATVNNVNPQLWITDSGTIGVYTLNWKFGTAATKIFQNGVDITTLIDPSGYAPVSGSKQITKTANGTFNYYISDCVRGTQGSLSCSGSYSPVSKTVTFPVPTVTASFNKTSINEANAGATNTTADLTWSSTDADSCSASGITGVSATSGNKTYTAPANLVTNQLHKVIVTCTGKGGSAQDDAELTLAALNDSPVATITSTINAREDEVFYIPFTATDEETTLTASHLIITSSDPAKVPVTNIQVELGANPRLVVTPVANASGTLTIKLKAKDPGNAESAEVTSNITIASVDDAPVISAINNVTINELAETTVNFTVTDIDSSVSGVTVSSNATGTVTPLLSGSGNSYSVKLTAGTINVDSSTAQAQITVQAPFSPDPITRSFTVNVNNLDPQLWIEETETIGVYDLHWRLATAAAQIYENGADITTMMDPSGYAPVSGTKRITKSANGTFNYYIRNCVRGTQGSFSCQGMYSPITKTVTFPLPTVTANFNKPVVNEANAGATNTTADLTWSSTDADSCSASGITGVSATSGNKTYTAPANLVTNQTHKVIVTCTGKGGSAQDEAELTLTALNDQPAMSAIVSPVITNEDEAVSINFTVNDEETLAADLDVTTTSSNPELIPDSNLQLTANGENRSLAITPLANQFGSAVITVTVKDATLEFSRQFTVNVNAVDDAPVISDIPAITINEGATSDWQVFTIADVDTISELEVTATTNGSTLVSNSNIYLEKTGSNIYRIAVKAGGRINTGGIDHEMVNVKIVVSGGSPASVEKILPVKVNNLPVQLTAPELSTSGLYEVTWDYAAYGVRIFENGADITHLIHPSGTAPGSGGRAFSKQESGIYNYAIKDCVYGPNGSFVCDHISDSKSVQVSLTAPSAPVLNSPPTSNTGEYVVTWTVIPGVINYRLYENDVLIHNSGSTFKAFQSTSRKGSGTYHYTVKACILSCSELSNIQTTVVTIASSSSKTSSSSPSSSASSKSSSSASSVNRKVIFIHTDLLGSPAAETNAEGNANE